MTEMPSKRRSGFHPSQDRTDTQDTQETIGPYIYIYKDKDYRVTVKVKTLAQANSKEARCLQSCRYTVMNITDILPLESSYQQIEKLCMLVCNARNPGLTSDLSNFSLQKLYKQESKQQYPLSYAHHVFLTYLPYTKKCEKCQ